MFGGYGTGLEKTKVGSTIRRGYYETAGYDVFGCWWITGYHYHLYYHQNILSLGARIFWNGLEFTS